MDSWNIVERSDIVYLEDFACECLRNKQDLELGRE